VGAQAAAQVLPLAAKLLSIWCSQNARAPSLVVQQLLHDIVAVALDALTLPHLPVDAINGVVLMLGSCHPGQFCCLVLLDAVRRLLHHIRHECCA
jgi:hypothetical protein